MTGGTVQLGVASNGGVVVLEEQGTTNLPVTVYTCPPNFKARIIRGNVTIAAGAGNNYWLAISQGGDQTNSETIMESTGSASWTFGVAALTNNTTGWTQAVKYTIPPELYPTDTLFINSNGGGTASWKIEIEQVPL